MNSYLNGEELNQMFFGILHMFELNVDILNKLNVFPVPDGDTGINMFLTLKDALAETKKTYAPKQSPFEFLQPLSKGALMGARGNSGVILSQFIKGFEIASMGIDNFDASILVESLKQSTIQSYNSVTEPQEGTMLTIIRSASDVAQKCHLENPDDLDYLITEICRESKKTLSETPTMLKTLSDAGVVDSGGHGIYIILDGMRQFCKSGTISLSVISPPDPKYSPKTATQKIYPSFVESKSDEDFGFCTQFLIREPVKSIIEIQSKIQEIASSVIVVGDDYSVIRVHCHSEIPQNILDYANSIGTPDEINIENMDDQFEEFKNDIKYSNETEDFAVISIVPGLGFEPIFLELGVIATILGGEKMNPTTTDLLTILESLDSHNIIILPNHENIILTANQSAKLSSKNVHILPTISIGEGISAMLGFLPQRTLLENLSNMQDSSKNVISGEINTAIRDARINDLQIFKGQKICSFGNSIVSASDSIINSLVQALKNNPPENQDAIITLYRGDKLNEQAGSEILNELRKSFPEIEFEMIFGGQSNHELLISIE